MSEWQPIETAPKDGSDFLCYWTPIVGDPQIVVARWQDERCAPWVGLMGVNVKALNGKGTISALEGGFPVSRILASHWMPLPAPPPPPVRRRVNDERS
jgi:hypothetical protein